MELKDGNLFHEKCYIDGAWVDADSGEMLTVNNPATGDTLGSIPKMGVSETERAIIAADVALPAWRAKTAKERSVILRKWYYGRGALFCVLH